MKKKHFTYLTVSIRNAYTASQSRAIYIESVIEPSKKFGAKYSKPQFEIKSIWSFGVQTYFSIVAAFPKETWKV
jgi:hypothetical protein